VREFIPALHLPRSGLALGPRPNKSLYSNHYKSRSAAINSGNEFPHSKMSQHEPLRRHLRLFDATTLVAGSMIGSAIFFALPFMAQRVATPGILLGLWVFGGLFTVVGAISCAELAAMFPHAGGQYVYLREAYNGFFGFLFGWTQFFVIQSGFIAAVAIAFAKGLGAFVPQLGEQNILFSLPLPLESGGKPLQYQLNSAQLVACGVIGVLTFVNWLGVRQGALVQNLFTVLKAAALVALIVAGLAHFRSLEHFRPWLEPVTGQKAVTAGFAAGLAVALSKALFAYDGWNTVTFVAEEVDDAPRNLPRALLLGSLVVTVLYLLTNAAYFAVLPVSEIAGVEENRVAQLVATTVFGPVGSTLVTVAILVSTFGCANGLLLGGARVNYAMAREGLFFRHCATLGANRTPTNALFYLAAWSMVLAITGSYDNLLTYTIFASVAFGGLMVAGVYVMRVKRPEMPRPYRCWGYPVTPAVYLLICVPFLVNVIQGDPSSTLIGAGLVVSGIPFYWVWKRRMGKSNSQGNP
jgi:basic amino acid/polyamine antiporter, APA family